MKETVSKDMRWTGIPEKQRGSHMALVFGPIIGQGGKEMADIS